jgi:hypothetical protein
MMFGKRELSVNSIKNKNTKCEHCRGTVHAACQSAV